MHPTVAAETHALLPALAAALGQPRIRALHLPPPLADGTRRGEFAAIELDDGSLGLSYVLLDGTLASLRDGSVRDTLPGRRALDVAQGLLEPPGIARTVGWAAAQALVHALARRAGWAPPAAGDSLGALAPGPGDHVGLVGLFGPLMERLVASGARITVLELRPELAGQHEGYEVTLNRKALGACNKLLATGTLVLNDTFDEVLAARHPDARIALVGPSVGVLPEVLFRRGVHVLGSTWVEDPASFVEALRAGVERKGSARKFTLERAQWPGLAALMAKV